MSDSSVRRHLARRGVIARNAKWHNCPACKSYRFTWRPETRQGRCQDCSHEVGA